MIHSHDDNFTQGSLNDLGFVLTDGNFFYQSFVFSLDSTYSFLALMFASHSYLYASKSTSLFSTMCETLACFQ